jgi:hypothetical protein
VEDWQLNNCGSLWYALPQKPQGIADMSQSTELALKELGMHWNIIFRYIA